MAVDPVPAILNWLKLTPPLALSLAVVIGLLLWGPDWFNDGVGLGQVIGQYRSYFGGAFLLSLIAGLTPVWSLIRRGCINGWNITQRRKRLKDLTTKEKAILRSYISQKTRTQRLEISSGVVQGLVDHQIIYRSASMGKLTLSGGKFDFNIQLWAWHYLRENPDLLEP